ncbi:hypothetical protein HII31_08139 [Pseudocercospora fuligena]|uniref:Cupin type-1 domain-containing protein n=1 Tax=Pseudocercospora fuligena TaxID=685502 RepID=A0A8H6REM1_9PEZI|nr:hypothetical protein HII31_08139 [Pseudocercospora fuligena]
MASPTSSSSIPQPELYWTKPNTHCPNSTLPVLVYRNVLPSDHSVESTTKAFESNNWIKGGVFKHYPTAHYHSNTHECYAAIRGQTKCLYGVGPLDDENDGVAFEMKAGDIAVHAAGVAHRNVESSGNYEYVGLYPKGAPHWDNNFCKGDLKETEMKAGAAKGVEIPDYDPVYGFDGPLPRIWKGVKIEAAA